MWIKVEFLLIEKCLPKHVSNDEKMSSPPTLNNFGGCSLKSAWQTIFQTLQNVYLLYLEQVSQYITIYTVLLFCHNILDCRKIRYFVASACLSRITRFPRHFFGKIPGTLNFYWCVAHKVVLASVSPSTNTLTPWYIPEITHKNLPRFGAQAPGCFLPKR